MDQKTAQQIYETGTIEDCGLIGSKEDAVWAGKMTPKDFYLNTWVKLHYLELRNVPSLADFCIATEDTELPRTVKSYVDSVNNKVFKS